MPDYSLPSDFFVTRDPCGSNPFSSEDVRHKVWAEATRQAEVKIARVNAAALSSVPATGTAETAKSLLLSQNEVTVGVFDAWAERGVNVVWSDEAMRNYDQWLNDYANKRIHLAERSFSSAPDFVPVTEILTHLRNRLAGRVQHWKAEAHRYRIDQDRYRAERETRDQAPFEPPDSISEDVKRWRKRQLKEHRSRAGMSAPDFARHIGMSTTTVLGIVREDRHRFGRENQRKLLQELGIAEKDWYQPPDTA